MDSYEEGCQVRTSYGNGVVIQQNQDKIVIELDEWELAGTSRALLYSNVSQIKTGSFCDIGGCILTKYGPGILFGYRRDCGIHVVRLFRPHGLGSATAYMMRHDIIQKIKCIPGMNVITPYGDGICLRYVHSKIPGFSTYIVLFKYGVGYLNESLSILCPEAKVIPTSEYLTDLAFKKIRWNEWGNSLLKQVNDGSPLLGNGLQPVWTNLTNIWGKIQSHEKDFDEILKERAKQIKEQVYYGYKIHHIICNLLLLL